MCMLTHGNTYVGYAAFSINTVCVFCEVYDFKDWSDHCLPASAKSLYTT